MKIIFAGVIAREALGGPAWVWLQYLLGFRRLGHEVYFLEESGEWPYVFDFETMEESDDPALGSAYIEKFLRPFGLGKSWVYRVGDECYGMAHEDWAELCHDADLMLVLPTSVWSWRPEYDAVRRRVFLDVDPGFTQFRAAQGDELIGAALEHCDRFFTFGPGINAPDSVIPKLGKTWQVTRPPVVVEEWPFRFDVAAECFTTLMQWNHDASPEYAGEVYGQKDVEFERILNLPQRTLQPLEVALGGGGEEHLREHGWQVTPGWRVSCDPMSYRAYIQAARGELSVAKNGYVKTRCGWVSDRTVCFLASGKPALVQETGLSQWLPKGSGLVTFQNAEEALTGLEHINSDYQTHCLAARELAEEYFDSDRVLDEFLQNVHG